MIYFFLEDTIKIVGDMVGEENRKSKRTQAIKTTYPGVFYYIDSNTKAKVWIARIKIGKLDTEQVVGRSDDQVKTNAFLAHQKRVELIAELKSGKSILKSDNPTLKQLFDTYMDTKGKTTVRAVNYPSYFKSHIADALGHKKLHEIKLRDLQNVVDNMIRAGYKVSHVRTLRDIVSNCYKIAIFENLIDFNLTEHIEFPKSDNNRYFNLDDESRKRLFDAIVNIPFIDYRVMFFFLLRGRRKGEVLKLKWSDIHFELGTYVIQDYNSKTRDRQEYFLDDELLVELQALKQLSGGNEYVFTNPKTNTKFGDIPRRFWEHIKEQTGIDNMRIHDFRHLLGFTMVNNGVPLESIGKALGHKKPSTTQKYSNMKAHMAKEAVDSYLDILKK